MNILDLKTVVLYSSTLVRRSWLFRLFAILTLFVITLFHISLQTHILGNMNWSTIVFPSSFPSINLSLYSLFMAFAVIFMAGMMLFKEKKLDTLDTLYARPMSNLSYVIGVCWGVIRNFLGWSLVLLTVSAMLNIFASRFPFAPGLYVFYFVSLLIPSLVFLSGLTFFMVSLLRNRAMVPILLSVYVAVNLFFIIKIQEGIWDPLGIYMPSIYSEITGFPELSVYLWQRTGFLLLGMGLLGLTAARFNRIPNAARSGSILIVISVVMLLSGTACLCRNAVNYVGKNELRQEYKAVFDRYSHTPKLNTLSHEIIYSQQDGQIRSTSLMHLKNNNREGMEEFVLYLNPALDVTDCRVNGEQVTTERDKQLIKIARPVSPGEVLELRLSYQGGIDERICYLDVSDKAVTTPYVLEISLLNYGKRYAFLTEKYTLLSPECIWYPVSLPPVNPADPFNLRLDFTEYTLKTVPPEHKTVISQGRQCMKGDTLVFRDEHPLSGITLCIGDYEKKSIVADSTEFDLYLFRGHDVFTAEFSHITDTLPQLIAALKQEIEAQKYRKYPFDRFMMVETPAPFATYYRDVMGGSGKIQPGMALLPEWGAEFWFIDFKSYRKFRKEWGRAQEGETEAEAEIEMFKKFVRDVFMDEYESNAFESPVLRSLFFVKDMTHLPINYVYEFSPLFLNYSVNIVSDDYPVFNLALLNVLKSDKSKQEDMIHTFDYLSANQDALNYFSGNSLKDALTDTSLKQGLRYEIIKYKSQALSNFYVAENVFQEQFKTFIGKFITEHAFQSVDISHYNEASLETLGIDCIRNLDEWYTSREVPAYIIRDLAFTELLGGKDMEQQESATPKYAITFSVYNNSGVSGMLSLNIYGSLSHDMDWSKMEYMTLGSYWLEAKKGKTVTVHIDVQPYIILLETNISRNLPGILKFQWESNTVFQDTTAGIKECDASRFLPSANEIIVDNTDPGFRINNRSVRALRHWLKKDSLKTMKVEKVFYPTRQWKPFLFTSFYGDYEYSAVCKAGGKGESSVSWSTNLEKDGLYEISVYVPKSFPFSFSSRQETGLQEMKQYYTVHTNEEEKEIILDFYSQREWVTLGTFDLRKGEAIVELSDRRTQKNQVVFADAVKWTYLGKDTN